MDDHNKLAAAELYLDILEAVAESDFPDELQNADFIRGIKVSAAYFVSRGLY